MKLRTSISIILPVILLTACSSDEKRLKEQGFQVFPEMNIALKCPCALKRNPTKEQQLQKEISGQVFSYSCKDSVDTEYVLEMVKERKSTGKPTEQTRDETLKAIKDAYAAEKQTVAGLPSIRYTYSPTAMASQVFHPKWNYFLIVHTSFHPQRDLKVVTSSVRFLED